jgi:hypothetical protein
MSVNCLFNDLRPDLTGLHVSVPKALPWIAAFDDLKDDEFYLAVGNAP